MKIRKLWLIIPLMLVGLMVVGCTATPAPTDTDTPATVVVPDDTEVKYIDDSGIPAIPEGFGIYGSTAEFDGVYPGWKGTIPVMIVNGQDRDRLFVISIREATKPTEGFEAFPTEYFYWLTVEKPQVTIPAGRTYQVPVTLEIPGDSDYAGKRAEVRILIEDTTQTGLVQIALETKWYIITAGQ